MLKKLIILGCVKTKKPCKEWQFVSAKDLYTSPLFLGRRAYAEAQEGVPWRILSAEHGLLHPNSRVKTYDTTIKQVPLARIHGPGLWHDVVRRHLLLKMDEGIIEIHAGVEYVARFEEAIESIADQYEIHTPMKGMGIGEQLKFYKPYRNNT